MNLASMLLKAGIATAGTGIYLLFRRFFRKVKKTTNDTAEKIETKLVKAKKKVTAKPRPKKVPVRSVNA
ncbi:MAG TPA: hypothetical protein VFT15_17205 [Chitinophagaceae bacterium]|nr:hypothetical protein [Chitinophagaceae bacterium]